jgi:hypothetical protein
MTASIFAPSPTAVGDERLWLTNPVYCIERLIDQWVGTDLDWATLPEKLSRLIDCLSLHEIRLPPEAMAKWAERGFLGSGHRLECATEFDYPRPGVVGLVVDSVVGDVWVVPLRAEKSSEWSADPTLPFSPPTVLQDLLVLLLTALKLPNAGAVPERFAFTIRDSLGRPCSGPSMNVAGVLAIIREANGNPPLLDGACAVVQADGDNLVQVASVRPKLEAFVREYGRGTLLVRHRQCAEAAAFDRSFDHCWVVSSVSDFAERLERQGFLRTFIKSIPLDLGDADVVGARLRRLKDSHHRYAEALDLSSRIQACGFRSNVPGELRREVRRSITDLYRHLGYHEKAEQLAREEVKRSLHLVASSYDAQALADVSLAAALFDSHRFEETVGILQPWYERLAAEPLIVLPMTRVMVFNTLGRARVTRGDTGWEEPFRRSLDILLQWEPTDLPRTLCYLAHGFIRHGLPKDAEEVLRQIEEHPDIHEVSRWFLRFYQAEQARRGGMQWISEDMENASPDRGRVGHPFGFYFQATARQAGRAADDAGRRFELASEFFLLEAPGTEYLNIQHFLADCMRLASAAWRNDRDLWDESRAAIAGRIKPAAGSGLVTYYSERFNALGSTPNREATEAFLTRVPFF